MKKTQEIIGLPIISIFDGNEVGKVKNIIINADGGAIDYIVVDAGIQILGARIVASKEILGIGEYAVTIESDEAIKDIGEVPLAADWMQKNVPVKATKVLTRKGSLIGEIGDIFVDEDAGCKIIGLEFIANISQKKVSIIPRECVITFGKNLIIVTENVKEMLLEEASDLQAALNACADENIAIDISMEEINEVSSYSEVAVSNSLQPVDENETISSEETPGDESAAALFEVKQRQYLNGRYVTKTITDNAGYIIIEDGMPIDDLVIDSAKNSGKLVELIMNNKA